ncbi:hypothetical protein [Azospirillum rugosum]|uniref:ECF transporter S component n=1 Tax=Azospirillum rugosum TaxID=416170 RepID=A0ABS4SDQ9_9PROT|nr:hypothetical protein [Azospirillum rugosum]MBP2290706.1 hypothetical protein [Azospirillum rugosum]MDQ0525595.1 hypothetical protein [Azospirillum rugosum]
MNKKLKALMGVALAAAIAGGLAMVDHYAGTALLPVFLPFLAGGL